MTDDRPADRNAHRISGSGDRYEALIEVLEQQKSQAEADRAREAEERRRRKEKRDNRYWLVLALLVVAGWLWVAPPDMLRVESPPPQPLAEEEAALRFAMYVQAQRIKAFREREGRLPEPLEEAGPPLPDMQYTPLGEDLYQLNGVTDRVTLTYRSDLPLEEFVGAGADVIDEAQIQ